MTKQEQKDLCRLLSKLLVDMYDETNNELYNECCIGFTIASHRVKAHIQFEVGEANE